MNDIQRSQEGQFQPGQSGNPAGRPKMDKTIRDLTRAFTEKAIATLIEIAENPKTTPAARVQACNSILDRAWGRPIQYSESEMRVGSSENLVLSVNPVDLEERIKLLIESRADHAMFK